MILYSNLLKLFLKIINFYKKTNYIKKFKIDK